MWTITISDLRYRASRFVVAVVGASVVFALALLLSGLAYSFRNEIRTTVDSAGAERWIVPADSPGPLATVKFAPVSAGDGIDAKVVDPFISLPQSAIVDGETHTITVMGHRVGGLGAPRLVKGDGITERGQVVTDELLGADIGETITVGELELEVVGHTRNNRMFAGQPNVFASIDDVREGVLSGGDVVTAFLTDVEPASLPDGFKAMTNDEVYDDTVRVMGSALDSVEVNRSLMWAVAVLIVAALIYITALERTRDFAVMKAMGARSALPLSSLMAQSVIVTVLAGLVAFGLSGFLKPLFALPIEVPGYAYRDLLVVAVVVGVLAGLAGARRAVTVEPSLAFAGA